MKPIPVAFHIGPLEVHTYGIGLAVTFAFAYFYFERRLRRNGYQTDWLVSVFLWIVLAAVVGARFMHVVSMLGYYSDRPGQILAIWQGGLSSFGGLLFAVPTGIILTKKRCPNSQSVAPSTSCARPHGGVGDGATPRTPAHGRWRRSPDPPVVRHVLREPSRPSTSRPDLPGARRLQRVPHLDRHRARLEPLAQRCRRGRATPRARCSGSRWCSGVSKRSSTSTCGSARTGTSDHSWCSWRASPWLLAAPSSCGRPGGVGKSGCRRTRPPMPSIRLRPQATSASGLKRPDRARWCLGVRLVA